jgi:hypothetical protein
LLVIFMVIGHWELIIDLNRENKSFNTANTGNSFVILLLVTSSLSTLRQLSIGVGFLQDWYAEL